MAFIDELKIYAKAGNGGDGVVRWRHEKFREFGGPSGGNGGNGGDVYVKAVRNLHLLSGYRTKKNFKAENGEPGRNKSEYGQNGEDLDILLPLGSIVTELRTNKKFELKKENERVLILKGGEGGRGNESFKSSTNQTPEEWTQGKEAEDGEFFIEIKLVADIGLIGLPNAGKTSLLNELTSAKGKIGDYPFTTLEPNLGEMYGYIISDIPGLIEGAALGKGLGHKFLRHVSRTKLLVHLVSLENANPTKAYQTIRKELEDYGEGLMDKKEIVVLTKTDLFTDESQIEKIKAKLQKALTQESKGHTLATQNDIAQVQTLSLYDDDSVKSFEKFLLEEVNTWTPSVQ